MLCFLFLFFLSWDRPSSDRPRTALPRTALPPDRPTFRSCFFPLPLQISLFVSLWGLLVKLWPRFKAVAHPNGTTGLNPRLGPSQSRPQGTRLLADLHAAEDHEHVPSKNVLFFVHFFFLFIFCHDPEPVLSNPESRMTRANQEVCSSSFLLSDHTW